MDEITIVDLDLSKTTWSRVHSSMRTLYLELSAEPDLDWIRLFREERESRVVLERHGLWIEDGYLVFDCLLDDVETHHLPDFRKSIDYANHKHAELQAARRRQGDEHRDATRDERARLAVLRAHVRAADPVTAPTAVAPEPPAAAASAPTAPAVAAAAPAPANGLESDAVFMARRDELRARLRAALQARMRELQRAGA